MGSTVVQIRRKGIITIPVKLRNQYALAEGDILTLEDLGDGTFLLVPRVSQVARLGDRVAEVLEEEDVTTEDILRALEEERETYYQEHYVTS